MRKRKGRAPSVLGQSDSEAWTGLVERDDRVDGDVSRVTKRLIGRVRREMKGRRVKWNGMERGEGAHVLFPVERCSSPVPDAGGGERERGRRSRKS